MENKNVFICVLNVFANSLCAMFIIKRILYMCVQYVLVIGVNLSKYVITTLLLLNVDMASKRSHLAITIIQ